MLGLGDLWIFCAIIGCLAVTAFGVVYGICNWNKGGENSPREKR